MTKDECLGFQKGKKEICVYCLKRRKVEKGSYISFLCKECSKLPCWEEGKIELTPCVPVSELKKAIKTVLERLWEEEKEDHCDMKSDWVQTWFLELEKELGLSKKTKPESDSSESLVKNRRLI